MARIILGITGGIAAYKTPELVRMLIKNGHEVRVVLSKGAEAFVSELSLQTVSGQPVAKTLLDAYSEAAMDHIELARWAEYILIAPASANRLAAIRLGLADDLLTTLCLATTSPIVIAPAMNKQMWHHPATQENVSILKSRGVEVIGPDYGEQACKEVGFGRMSDLEILASYFNFNDTVFKNKNILVTAGPTREPIDPVRSLSNRSSGKMGFAVAAEAARLGAQVTLISGPVSLSTPAHVTRINVETAQEMYQAVHQEMSHEIDIFISVAAVADFSPINTSLKKIKKGSKEEALQVQFKLNPDILLSVTALNPKPFCVGFAAETNDGPENAKQKLIQKSLDMIALNWINTPYNGFDCDTNSLHVFWPDGEAMLPLASKNQIAKKLLELIGQQYEAARTT